MDNELKELVNLVRAHRGLPPVDSLEKGMRLRDDLQLASLDLAELTVRIEERFGVDVFKQGIVREWGEVRERVKKHVDNAST